MQPIYLICGVPGSGKTWVCDQLENDFTYVAHDDHVNKTYPMELFNYSRTSDKPILADCPFAERVLREELIARNLKVIPVFIVEDAQTVKARYEKREQRSIPKNFLTRAQTIGARAAEWKAFRGTSAEVLAHLKGIAHG